MPSTLAYYRTFKQKFLELLRIRSLVGGLEISDSSLRYAAYNGSTWQFSAVRLPPGILENGVIKKSEEFMQALRLLHIDILKNKNHQPINVVVVLGSVNVYTQVFNLPSIDEGRLEEAVNLNIQMVSPTDLSRVHVGWQALSSMKENSLEILAAFINRDVTDAMAQTLEKAGFLTFAVESKALALVRVARSMVSTFSPKNPSVIAVLDDSGIDFLIVREGQLHFEYFVSWRDVQGGGRLSSAAFESLLSKSLTQVLNFYSQHWPELPKEIFISTFGFYSQIEEAINKSGIPIVVRELHVNTAPPIPPQWLAALGAGLRGTIPRGDDREISLLGLGARQEFTRRQLETFLHFWRITAPAALLLLSFAFFFTYTFLKRTNQILEGLAQTDIHSAQVKELDTFEARARSFNRVVAMVQFAQGVAQPKNPVFSKLEMLLKSNTIQLTRINFPSISSPMTISGSAPAYEQILNLKRALESDSEFSNVILPLSGIVSTSQGVTFSVTFAITSFNSAKTP